MQPVSWKQTQRRRGVFREPLMLLLKLLWRASVSTWAWTPSQTSALHRPAPPVPSNQSTFLINCIQIGRHLLERASEKTCFPPRLFWARCYFCLQTKAHYPHTMGALSKENTQTRGSQTFDFVFLRPCSQWKKKKHICEPFGELGG